MLGQFYGEKLNALAHFVGTLLALAGVTVLIVLAALEGDEWMVAGMTIYGATLVLLYTFSTLYHSLHGRAKVIFRELDYHGIYLLIAGSYTPFCLVTLRGSWRWRCSGWLGGRLCWAASWSSGQSEASASWRWSFTS